MSWDARGPVGVVAGLLQNQLPSFDGVSYATVELAANAIAAAELVIQLNNPIAVQTVCFVHDGVGQSQAAITIAANALSFRIGTTVGDMTTPDPTSLSPDCVMKVYRRTQNYFSHMPKMEKFKLPVWFQTWKTALEADAATRRREQPSTTEANIKSEPREGGDEATPPAAAATGDKTATGVGTSVRPFVRGDTVIALIKQKRVKVVIDECLPKHCWVTVIEGNDAATAARRKISNEKLSHIVPGPNDKVEEQKDSVEEQKDPWLDCRCLSLIHI